MLYKKAAEMTPTPIPNCMGGEGTVMMERLLDATKFPQAFSTPRAFGGDAAGRGGAAAGTGPKTGKLATFTVRVIFRQNASWQGSVSWLEGENEQRFRSVLELLLLLDSALTSVNRMEKSG